MSDPPDYRKLLKAYMAGVMAYEGISFVSHIYWREHGLSYDDETVLWNLQEEIAKKDKAA